ncbi:MULTISPECIES: hypothetical protein [Frankia]|uniref:hypothetical protein n=1 Tax=Frankia TaxID=1854 RepID=UPI000FF88596|nr:MULTISPECIES: hypothetical protein [Frankia]
MSIRARSRLDWLPVRGRRCIRHTRSPSSSSFKGHLAFHVGQLDATVGLSRAASRDGRVWIGQRAYDAHQEARAHALAGRRREAVEALARGADLAAAAGQDGQAVPAWIYYYTPEFYALERGWACHYLGRDDPAYNEEAIACLTGGLAGLGKARDSAGSVALRDGGAWLTLPNS